MLGQSFVVLTLVALGTVPFGPGLATPPSQSTVACTIYAAGIAFASDSSSVVVVDSTTTGVPMFAFNAYSSSPRTPAQQGLPLPDSMLQALQTANEHRESLRGCLATIAGVEPVSDDTLMAIFGRDHKGWTRFRTRYQSIKRFVLVSRPLTLPDSSVLLYVAYASDWLAGAGVILHLQRDAGGHWTRKAQALLWIS